MKTASAANRELLVNCSLIFAVRPKADGCRPAEPALSVGAIALTSVLPKELDTVFGRGDIEGSSGGLQMLVDLSAHAPSVLPAFGLALASGVSIFSTSCFGGTSAEAFADKRLRAALPF
jgi:hypothetical protein